jgi:hypothetical protein
MIFVGIAVKKNNEVPNRKNEGPQSDAFEALTDRFLFSYLELLTNSSLDLASLLLRPLGQSISLSSTIRHLRLTVSETLTPPMRLFLIQSVIESLSFFLISPAWHLHHSNTVEFSFSWSVSLSLTLTLFFNLEIPNRKCPDNKALVN